MLRPFLLAAALALAAPAGAQIALPSLPNVGGVIQRAPEIGNEVLNAQPLQEVRRLQVRDLLRNNRRELEADPQGEPIVRARLLAIAPSEAALQAAAAAGFQVERRDEIEDVGPLVSLRAPPRMSTRRALRRLQQLDPAGVYDYDHLNLPAGLVDRAPATPAVRVAPTGVRIGLVDSGVSTTAPFASAIVEQRGFATPTAIPGAHGDAVAGLLVGRGGAELVVADIYGGTPTGGTSSALARALGWLSHQETPVINISLVGPRNRIVEAVVAQLIARGFTIVAAVGNDGPAAPPLFPASYPGVVGVTGVDVHERVLIEAGRGPQVDFAAPGIVNGSLRGTSFAAPIVGRRLADMISAPDPAAARRAQEVLRAQAQDLGARGRDDIYGDGLVNAARSN
jgi:subtilisin family serine protease